MSVCMSEPHQNRFCKAGTSEKLLRFYERIQVLKFQAEDLIIELLKLLSLTEVPSLERSEQSGEQRAGLQAGKRE